MVPRPPGHAQGSKGYLCPTATALTNGSYGCGDNKNAHGPDISMGSSILNLVGSCAFVRSMDLAMEIPMNAELRGGCAGTID